MPDFLNRLAARALGDLPVAEPLLASRFTPRARELALSPFDSIHDSAEPSNSFSTYPGRTSAHQALTGVPKNKFDPSDSIKSPEHAHLQFVSQNRDTSFLQNLQKRVLIEPEHMLPPMLNEHSERSAPPLRPAISAPADFAPGSFETAPPPVAVPLFVQPRPLLPERAAQASRDPSREQQQRISRLRAPQPIVRVTIGRIEVRAEMAAPAPAAPTTRPRPSHLSLAQFLADPGGGTR